MSLGYSLTLVMAAFLTVLATVITMSFRERRLARTLARDDARGQQASDARMLVTIFAAIPAGMLLTLTVAWLVFL